MSAFGDAIAQGLASIGDVAGETVTYTRGADTIGGLTAVPGSTKFGTEEVEGFGIGFVSNDWIFDAAKLLIAGVKITPKRGDLVKWTKGGVQRMYEVLKDAGGGPPYRFSDSARTRIRVHTKEKPAA
jgi:hypothetical protein